MIESQFVRSSRANNKIQQIDYAFLFLIRKFDLQQKVLIFF